MKVKYFLCVYSYILKLFTVRRHIQEEDTHAHADVRAHTQSILMIQNPKAGRRMPTLKREPNVLEYEGLSEHPCTNDRFKPAWLSAAQEELFLGWERCSYKTPATCVYPTASVVSQAL